MIDDVLIHRYALYVDYMSNIRVVATSNNLKFLEELYNKEVSKVLYDDECVKCIVYIYDYDKDARIKEFDYDTDIS